MTNPMTDIDIPFSKLIDHPGNVRAQSTETYDPENLGDLVASIEELGLINRLVVQKIGDKYGVLAGARRKAAIKLLVARKDCKAFTAKTKIACREVNADCDVTTALSLAENVTQLPMNAIDQYEAYAKMFDEDGKSIDDIAKTFGITEANVKARLRIGRVHPEIRAAVRNKDITLDALKAFAEHPSQDIQLEVYNGLIEANSHMGTYSIQQALKRRGINASDDLGAFVLDDYKAAGGDTVGDLLAEHDILTDLPLIEKVLLAKLQAAAEEKRAALGFAWADAQVEHDYGMFSAFGRVYPQPLEPKDEDKSRVDELTAKMEAFEAQMEQEDISVEDYNAAYDACDALQDELNGLIEGYAPDDLERAGVFATWNGGNVHLTLGLVRRDAKASSGGNSQDGSTAEPSADESDEIVYSSALSADLQTERAMAFGAALAQSPEAATDLALFKLVTDVVGGIACTYGIDLRASKEHRSHAKMDEIDATSLNQMGEAHDALDLSWADQDRSPADQFAGFRNLAPEEKQKLVAFAVGSTTKNSFARNVQTDTLMASIEAEVMPDVRAHWSPNAALFSRFKKSWLLRILSDDLGLTQEALALAGSKKGQIVDFCDQLFAEPFATLTDAQREAVARWTPPLMQTHMLETASDDDAEAQDIAA